MRYPRPRPSPDTPGHPALSRRLALQAGAIGLLGLAMDHLQALRTAVAADGSARHDPRARSVIYIFLSGGLAQHDSFDLKPDAPEDIRGEFRPIATRHAGRPASASTCPMLAARSHLWSLVRSLTHPSNDHSAGHHIMLTGRSDLPPGFDPARPQADRLAVDRRRRRRRWPRRGTTCRRPSSCPSGSSTTPGGSSPASSPA